MIQKKTIQELCQIIGGNPSPKENEFSKDGIPFVKMMDLGRYHLTNNLIKVDYKISPDYPKYKSLKNIPKGSILLPRSGSVGLNHRAILGMDAFIVSHICALNIIDNNLVHNKYLYYYLSSIDMVNITKQTTGLDAITFEDLGKIKIPLPLLKTQKKIAAILDKADELRQNDKKIFEKYDQLAKSVFLEMFGDPVTNSKNWVTDSLINRVKMQGGGTPSKKIPEYYTGSIPWVSPKDMKYNYITKSIDYITEEALQKSSANLIEPYSVLLVVRSGILKNLLPVAINLVPIAINQDMKALKCKVGLNPYFLMHHLRCQSSKILQTVRGTTADNISSDVLKKITITLPPGDLQDSFAKIIVNIEKQRQLTEISLQKSEELFQSLLLRAFKGTL